MRKICKKCGVKSVISKLFLVDNCYYHDACMPPIAVGSSREKCPRHGRLFVSFPTLCKTDFGFLRYAVAGTVQIFLDEQPHLQCDCDLTDL